MNVEYLHHLRAPYRRPNTAKERITNASLRLSGIMESVEQIARDKLEDAAMGHQIASLKQVASAWLEDDLEKRMTYLEEAGYHALAAKVYRARASEPVKPQDTSA